MKKIENALWQFVDWVLFLSMIIMVIVDLLYAVVDPRIRAKYSGGKRKKKKIALGEEAG